MRNFLTLALALGLAGSVQAQNSATTNQSGDNNNTDVTQSYSAGDVSTVNTVTIDQAGSRLEATAKQQGAGNLIDIDQAGFRHETNAEELLGYGNTMLIEQVGGDASAMTGGFNRVSAAMRGDDNDVNIFQNGSGNRSLINAKARQNDGNVLDLDQIGDQNEIEIRFGNGGNDRNTITARQEGDRNTLGVVGGGADGIFFQQNGDDNTIDALQDGDDNSASISIGQSASFNTVDLDQLSNGNTATITVVAGSNNSAVISQQ